MKNFISIVIFLASLFGYDSIEGRWHLVGYEDNVMYQFENNLRYSIYSIDGTFGGLDEAGGSPNPYTIDNDIITIDLFFGTIVSYQMNFLCDGQVVEFKTIPEGVVHTTLFREGYNYSDCDSCFDFTGIDFGLCEMYLGVGFLDNECNYMSGCGWEIDGVDYSDLFFDSLDECQESCIDNQCEEGFIEINDLCFHEGDINVIQIMLDNSYQSGIDLDCDGSQYCGSPNPFMDSNGNGVVEPLELGIQEWQDGRLTRFMCGAYIYCQLSGPIPEEINNLSELEVFRVEGNYFSGFIPESICDLEVDYGNSLDFDIRYNHLCPPYPECIDTDDGFWGQYDEDCIEIGDLNNDSQINVLDIVLLVSFILFDDEPTESEFFLGDVNFDNNLNVLDVVELVSIIIN